MYPSGLAHHATSRPSCSRTGNADARAARDLRAGSNSSRLLQKPCGSGAQPRSVDRRSPASARKCVIATGGAVEVFGQCLTQPTPGTSVSAPSNGSARKSSPARTVAALFRDRSWRARIALPRFLKRLRHAVRSVRRAHRKSAHSVVPMNRMPSMTRVFALQPIRCPARRKSSRRRLWILVEIGVVVLVIAGNVKDRHRPSMARREAGQREKSRFQQPRFPETDRSRYRPRAPEDRLPVPVRSRDSDGLRCAGRKATWSFHECSLG